MHKCPIMWVSVHEFQLHHWKKILVIVTVIFVCLSSFLYMGWLREFEKQDEISILHLQLKNYKVRNEILSILRTKGITLGQGLDIADALMIQCKEKNIPVELGLAIMKRESDFNTQAISSMNAKGLMQLLVTTYESYNKNLQLGLPRQAIFDPIVNIRISVLHLSDLISEIKPKVKSMDEMWKKVLIAYSGDAKGYPESVMKMQREYEVRFRDGEI